MSWTSIRATLAAAVRDGAPPERIEQLRAQLRVGHLEARIRSLVAEHPLTGEQREVLTAALYERSA